MFVLNGSNWGSRELPREAIPSESANAKTRLLQYGLSLAHRIGACQIFIWGLEITTRLLIDSNQVATGRLSDGNNRSIEKTLARDFFQLVSSIFDVFLKALVHIFGEDHHDETKSLARQPVCPMR